MPILVPSDWASTPPKARSTMKAVTPRERLDGSCVA